MLLYAWVVLFCFLFSSYCANRSKYNSYKRLHDKCCDSAVACGTNERSDKVTVGLLSVPRLEL